jgi:coproporphyrinogen III oxidase-like Fe-S oxidoreductase
MPEGPIAAPLAVAEARASKPVPRCTGHPTAARLSPAVTASTCGTWLGGIPAGSPLSFSVHVPFCVPIGLDHFARPDDPLAEAAAAGRLC